MGRLLEREAELATLDRLLGGAASGAGGVLLLVGPAGIGKTSLLDATADRALATGVTVHRARGRAPEQHFAFGATLQLLEARVRAVPPPERDALLSGAAGLVRPLLEHGDGAAPAGDPFPLLHGLHWLVAGLAERDGPLCLLVDDAQWADGPSLLFLAYLAHRVAELPVALVAAVRTGEPATSPELAALLDGADQLEPAPLTAEAVTRAVTEAFGDEPDRAFAAACAQVTGGNPFLLHELLREARRRDLAPRAEAAAAVRRLSPGTVTRRVLARLRALPDPAAAMARALAIAGDDTPIDRVAALAGVEPAAGARAIDALAAASIVTASSRPAFVHPLVHAAIAADLGAGERERGHARAAALLDAAGEPPERVAEHLLAMNGDGDARAIEILREAGERAAARGAPRAAAAFLARALAMPASRAHRPALLAQLALAEVAAGTPTAADRLLEAVDAAPAPSERVRLVLVACGHLYASGRTEEAAELLERELRRPADIPEALRRDLEAARFTTLALDPVRMAKADAGVKDVLTGERSPASAAERALLAGESLRRMLFVDRTAAEATAMAMRAWDGGAVLADPNGSQTLGILCGALVAGDDLVREEELLDVAVAEAQARGSIIDVATASYCRSCPRLYRGKLLDAMADAEQALAAVPYGWHAYANGPRVVLTLAALARDDLDAAEAAIEAADLGPGVPTVAVAPVFTTIAKVRLARGDLEGALEAAMECERRSPVPTPLLFSDWRSTAAIALARLGDRERARALADEDVALLRAWGAPGPLAVALRARGLVERGEAALPWLEEAVAMAERSPSVLTQAGVLIEHGAVLRRLGQRAAADEPLRRGLEIAAHCGAHHFERRAREELRASGRRPRRTALRGVDALTPAERRVADLAAGGMSNREIAQALFVTVKAVEKHLANAYPKLGIRSRRELPGALGRTRT